jgi:hypothetical protein
MLKKVMNDLWLETPCKERYIAGSSTCSTKELSIHLTKILSAVKEGQQKYCERVFIVILHICLVVPIYNNYKAVSQLRSKYKIYITALLLSQD